QGNFLAAFIAGFGVIGLHHWLNENYISIPNRLFDVVNLLEVYVVLLEISLEVVGEAHIWGRNERDRAIELAQSITERMHGAHAHIADGQPFESVDATLLAQDGI